MNRTSKKEGLSKAQASKAQASKAQASKFEQLAKSFSLTTKVEDFFAWGRKHSLWPMPYGTACCGIELMSVFGTQVRHGSLWS